MGGLRGVSGVHKDGTSRGIMTVFHSWGSGLEFLFFVLVGDEIVGLLVDDGFGPRTAKGLNGFKTYPA